MRKYICAALLLIPLAGCGGEPAEAETAAPQTQIVDEVAPAKAGGKTDPCTMPVTFDVAEDWKPKAVTLTGDVWDELAKQGDATALCEIDAKPAGNIGFLRVWRSPAATEKAALESFLTAEKGSSAVEYRDLPNGVEVSWRVTTELTPEGKDERAMAVKTSDGTVIISLSGFDDEEFEEMLPAYVLAKSTLVVN